MAQILPFMQENKICFNSNSVYIRICDEAKDMVKLPDKYKKKNFRDVIENIIFFSKRLFRKIEIQEIESGRIYKIPSTLFRRESGQRVQIEKDILRVILKESCNYIVIPKEYGHLYQREELKKYQDKMLFCYLIYDTIKYIMKIRNELAQESDLYITVNKNTKVNIEIILYLANYFKSIHIVTNHINQFSILEEDLYTRRGIVVTVANNKRKSLLKARYLVNLDFTNDIIKQYTISRQVTIFNLMDEKMNMSNTFQGIIVNQIHITYGKKIKEYFMQYCCEKEYEQNILYRSLINDKIPFSMVENKLLQDDIRITQLIGNSGVLSFDEMKHDRINK